MIFGEQQQIDAKTAGEAAGNWWAWVLRHPDTTKYGTEVMEVKAYHAGVRHYVTEPTLFDGFGRVLADKLDEELKSPEESIDYRLYGHYLPDSGIPVGVDYGPDTVLYDTALEVGIFVHGGGVRWPHKTYMRVKLDLVRVSYNAGAPHEIIWTNKS